MAFGARVELDSISPAGIRLLTGVITFPRIVLAEVYTHRKLGEQSECEITTEVVSFERTADIYLSKSSASSRAIPVSKMLAAVQEDPYVPQRFSAAGKGMQESGWLEGTDHNKAVKAWLDARDHAVACVKQLLEVGVHKQDANRLLEPWAWVTQIVTGDQFGWANFFALRTDRHAHPAFRKIARMMYLYYIESTPMLVHYNHYHAPFLDPDESHALHEACRCLNADVIHDLRRISAARCARVSYNNHEGKRATRDEDLALYDRLAAAQPRHAAPTEHVAMPLSEKDSHERPHLLCNFEGWTQLRKIAVPGEYVRHFEASPEEVHAWRRDAW